MFSVCPTYHPRPQRGSLQLPPLPSPSAATFPLSDLASSNWTAVNPVMAQTANPRQWPITLGTYFYVFQDLAFLKGSGG